MSITVPAPSTLADVDVLLGTIRALRQDVAVVVADYDAQIQALEEAKAAKLAEPLAAIKAHEAALREYLATNRTMFTEAAPGKKAPPKSKALVNGKIGCRLGNERVVYTVDEETTVTAIKALKLRDLLVTVKKPVKAKLVRLPLETQHKIGVRVVRSETDWYAIAGSEAITFGGEAEEGKDDV